MSLADERLIEEGKLRIEANDLAALMATIEGRRFVWRFLSKCGIFRQSYVSDSNGTAFNEGQRSIGLMLYAELQLACADLYLEMQREAVISAELDRKRKDDERSKRSLDD